MRELVKVFKAVSDETRIRLLKLFSEREVCVCELVQALNMTQSRVSRNLGILKDAGLVRVRKKSSQVVPVSGHQQQYHAHPNLIV